MFSEKLKPYFYSLALAMGVFAFVAWIYATPPTQPPTEAANWSHTASQADYSTGVNVSTPAATRATHERADKRSGRARLARAARLSRASQFVPRYELLSKEDSTLYKNVPRLRIRIVVPDGLTREHLEETLRAAGQSILESDQPMGFTLFAYKKGTDTKGEYTAGRVEYGPGGDAGRVGESEEEPRMQIDLAGFYFQSGTDPTDLEDSAWTRYGLSDHKARSSKRSGDAANPSEEVRRAIFYELAAGEDRASKEAEEEFPMPDEVSDAARDAINKRAQREEDLTEQSERSIARRHHLSGSQVQAIKQEGMLQHWPTPDPQ